MAIRFIYTSSGTISVGTTVYGDSSLTAFAADGVYSDGVNSYTVVSGVVTASAPCPTETTTTTTVPSLGAIAIVLANPTDTSVNNGSVQVNEVGGVPGYTYSIDGVNYQASNVFTGLASGSFTLYVKDSIGQVASDVAILVAGETTTTSTTSTSTTSTSTTSTTTLACVCPTGYTYNATLDLCEKSDEIPATPPAGATTYTYGYAQASNIYSYKGLATYDPGYNTDGTGTYQLTQETSEIFGPQTDAIWKRFIQANGLSIQGFDFTGAGNEVIGVTKCITIPETKTYYVLVAGDDWMGIKVDGVTVVDMDMDAMNANLPRTASEISTGTNTTFTYTHAYPVTLTAGQHIIEMYAQNQPPFGPTLGNGMVIGAVIFAGTKAELQSMQTWDDWAYQVDVAGNVIYRSVEEVNKTFTAGPNLEDFTCPTGYVLNKCGDSPVCTLYDTVACGGEIETTTTTTVAPSGAVGDNISILIENEPTLDVIYGSNQILTTAEINDNGSIVSFLNYNPLAGGLGYSDTATVAGVGGANVKLVLTSDGGSNNDFQDTYNLTPVLRWTDANGILHDNIAANRIGFNYEFDVLLSEADFTAPNYSDPAITISIYWVGL